jgi:large subunit ribosomal protein L20
MPRVTRGKVAHRRHKKLLKAARGFRGGRSKVYKTARHSLYKAMQHATRARKKKKRDFRKLWIIRLNAAARMRGMSYSRFIEGLRKAEVLVDRKMLAEIAVTDPSAFDAIVVKAKTALA